MAKGTTTAEMTDEQFVANLYHNLLQRSPESGEVKHWTGVLATGSTRSDVVEVFMSSSEFITLQSQKERFRVSSPGSGDLKGSEQEILSKLQTHVARQQSVDTVDIDIKDTVDTGRQGTTSPAMDCDEIGLPARAKLSPRLWEAKDSVGQINPRNAGPLNFIAQKVKQALQRSLAWHTRSLQNFHSEVVKALEGQENGINRLDSSVRSIDRSLRNVDQKTLRLGSEISRVDDEISRVDDKISRLDREILRLQSGYLQELLRANELAVQEQLIPYVEFFRETAPVLDLGCGRGEFLVLLKESGISSYGVDSDETACEAGRRRSLRIIKEDLVEHLRQIPDRSLGGIFSARVIEFLPANRQMELISLCSTKIKPGGVLIVETTNPDSRRGHGRISYLDPTHLLPVPPELMKSALETNGFQGVKIMVFAPVEERLAQVASAAKSDNGSEHGAHALPVVSNRLAVSPSYAAVGWRS